MTTRRRIDLIAHAYPRLFPQAELLRLVRSQLGHVDAIDRSQARAPKLIYHICAGNLAVSAWTSIMHGLVLGSRNVIKLPGEREDSSARREILDFIRGLPKALRDLVETHAKLDTKILREADAVIAFGSDATMDSIRGQLRWDQKFIAHGHAVSLLWISDPDRLTTGEARACAIDVLTYDQLGCLSPQAIYVPPGTDSDLVGEKLAEALEWAVGRVSLGANYFDSASSVSRKSPSPPLGQRRLPPRGLPPRPLGVAARIAEARDLAHALGHRVWLPASRHLGWTVIHDPDPAFQPSPLHGVIVIRQAAESRMKEALASVAGRISTVGVARQISSRLRDGFVSLGVSRFCKAGRMQFPPLTWHHDGRAPLAELVTWVDFEDS